MVKPRHSGGDQDECLEVAPGHSHVPVRDSKATHIPPGVLAERLGGVRHPGRGGRIRGQAGCVRPRGG
ncbi:DUF397 domain-containing protein [Streptomyces paradoxus]|uniref:DUF397 domain-containing protein n=1 Tax=Streptomyces paradoxus TaxID=66375 RepID=UPI0037F7BC77